jgi:YHS domain-containing protein
MSEDMQAGSPHHSDKAPVLLKKRTTLPEAARRNPARTVVVRESDGGLGYADEEDSFSASRGRLELLKLGVRESQLAELTKNKTYLTYAELRSPVRGLLLSRNVSPRQRIDRGTECFRIADLSRVWVEVDLYDSEAKHIQPGMEVRISLPKQNEQFAATVSEVLPRFDAVSRSLKVRLEMDNPASLFRPDMFVDVQFLIPLPESITVPSSAVIDSGKRKTVYVVVGEGVFEPREVATGWQTSDRIEVVEGLQPGEKIVVSGNFLIDSESRMKLAAARLMENKVAQPAQLQVPAAAEPAPTSTAAPSPAPNPTMPAADTQKTSAEKVKDPVCGMTVNQDRAIADGLKAEVEGETYFFCSEECKEQFKQDPQRFLTKKTGQPVHTDASAHGGHPHD